MLGDVLDTNRVARRTQLVYFYSRHQGESLDVQTNECIVPEIGSIAESSPNWRSEDSSIRARDG